MEMLYLSVLSALSIVLIFFAFISGLHYGSKTKKNDVIDLPNPQKKIKAHFENKRVEEARNREQEIEEINLANIDSYDGTEIGQKQFPK